MKRKQTPFAMLSIGTNKEAIAEARAALMDILNTERAGDTAKVAACDALKTLCEIKAANVSNCTFNA